MIVILTLRCDPLTLQNTRLFGFGEGLPDVVIQLDLILLDEENDR